MPHVITMDYKKEKLADKAYRLLEELIVTLALPPGSILNEPDLSAELKIGRTPIREALQRLAADNLVLIQPRRAIIVSDVYVSEHLVVLETRRVLEHLIALSAAKRATLAERDRLRKCADEISLCASEGDIQNFMRLDKEFDAILGQASRNYFAARSCAPLQSLSRRFWFYHQEAGGLIESANLHRNIMLAVADANKQDAGRASDALMDYLESAARKALEAI